MHASLVDQSIKQVDANIVFWCAKYLLGVIFILTNKQSVSLDSNRFPGHANIYFATAIGLDVI